MNSVESERVVRCLEELELIRSRKRVMNLERLRVLKNP